MLTEKEGLYRIIFYRTRCYDLKLPIPFCIQAQCAFSGIKHSPLHSEIFRVGKDLFRYIKESLFQSKTPLDSEFVILQSHFLRIGIELQIQISNVGLYPELENRRFSKSRQIDKNFSIGSEIFIACSKDIN